MSLVSEWSILFSSQERTFQGVNWPRSENAVIAFQKLGTTGVMLKYAGDYGMYCEVGDASWASLVHCRCRHT